MKKIFQNKHIRSILFGLGGLIIGMFIFGGVDNHSHPSGDHELVEEAPGVWTCSMHPQIKMDKPGKCPICAMDLIPMRTGSGGSDEAVDPASIQLSAEAVALANIQTMKVAKGVQQKEIRLYGKIMPDERVLQSQTAHVGGRIEKLNIDFTGQFVKKGETIASLYSPDLQNAQQEMLIAIQTGQQSLIEATKKKLRNWKMTDAQIQEIQQQGKVSASILLKANTSGIVIARNVSEGDYVSSGDVLFEVANLGQVWAVFDAFEADLPYLKVGDQLNFTLQALPGKDLTGKISFIDPVLNGSTRTARIRVDVKNPNMELKPEMYATAVVESKIKSDANDLVIPQSAILWTGKRSVVYVKQPGTTTPTYKMREVVLGEKLQQAYVIKEGVAAGEEIVVNGSFTIDASAQLEGKPSMMNNDNAVNNDASLKQELISVSGACEMCKDRIEKAALSVMGVKKADWNLETHQLQIAYDDMMTDLTQIGNQIAAVGHDNDVKKSDDAVYNALPECCQYK